MLSDLQMQEETWHLYAKVIKIIIYFIILYLSKFNKEIDLTN
jgi:hypothetical protein